MAPDQQQVEVHGHRGCRGILPENTIPSFLKATALGVHALELDVVITGDRQVLVSHEPWFAAAYCLKPDGTSITPPEEKQFNVYRLLYSIIKTYDCGSKPHPRFPHQQNQPAYKPLLSEVIEAVEDFCQQENIKPPYFNIEIKSTEAGDNIFHPEPEEFVNLLLQVLGSYNLEGKVMVQSFDVRPLQVLHQVKPAIQLGLLTEDLTPPEERLQQLGFIPYAYNPAYALATTDLLKLLKQKGIKCFVWTVNDEVTTKQMLDMGVDGIITDYPEMVIESIKCYAESTKT